jgi:hypothetical protein
MVSTFKTTLVGWATLLLLLVFCQRAYGVIGDCDNNGSITPMDAVYVLNYLEGTVPPPVNYADCDCDGFPGVNIADALQIIAHIFQSASLYAWPGADLIAPAKTSIMISGKVDGTTLTKTFIFINNPSALNGGLTLPFSFAAGPGEADLDCINITVGPLFSGVTSSIDNVGKTFRLNGANTTIVATANWEVLCEVDFALGAGGSQGNAVTVDPTTTGRYFPLLMTTMAYNGINYRRMLFPRFVPDTFGTIGDVNCDGMRNISDAVYLIAYIFSGGNPPGDPDGDGVPDCPVP